MTGIVVEIEETDRGLYPKDVQVMTDQGLEWWEEDELELV